MYHKISRKIARLRRSKYEKTKRQIRKIHKKTPLKKVDLHIHTWFSKEHLPGGKLRDGCFDKTADLVIKIAHYLRFQRFKKDYELYFRPRIKPLKVYKKALKKKLDYFAITDHDTVDGCYDLLKKCPEAEKMLIIGEEVSTTLKVGDELVPLHMNVFDINREIHKEIQSLKHDTEKLVEYLKKKKILHSINHIADYEWKRRFVTYEEINKIIDLFDIFEIRNSLILKPFNRLAALIAQMHNKKVVAGSDSHTNRVGSVCTYAVANSKEEFLDQIRKGNVYVSGRHCSLKQLAMEFVDKVKRCKSIYLDNEKIYFTSSRMASFIYNRARSYMIKNKQHFMNRYINYHQKNLHNLYKIYSKLRKFRVQKISQTKTEK